MLHPVHGSRHADDQHHPEQIRRLTLLKIVLEEFLRPQHQRVPKTQERQPPRFQFDGDDFQLGPVLVVRTAPTPGRGGASYSTFVYERAKQDPPLTEAGPVGADEYWERITYFLKRVIPVAEEYMVRMACHPHDPGMPRDKGYRGVRTVLDVSRWGARVWFLILPGLVYTLAFGGAIGVGWLIGVAGRG